MGELKQDVNKKVVSWANFMRLYRISSLNVGRTIFGTKDCTIEWRRIKIKDKGKDLFNILYLESIRILLVSQGIIEYGTNQF